MLKASPKWIITYPTAYIGILALSNVHNPTDSMELGIRKQQLEEELPGRFAGMDRLRLKSVQLSEYLIYLFDEWLAPLEFDLGTPRDPELRGSHVSLKHPEAF